MPIAGTNFKYSFQADLEFTAINQFNKAIEKIQSLTEKVSVFGVYKNGNNS